MAGTAVGQFGGSALNKWGEKEEEKAGGPT